MNQFAMLLRNGLLPNVHGSHLISLHCSASLFSQGQPADSLYLIENGLVKLTRTNKRGNKVITQICGPNHLVGEEALSVDVQNYLAEAEALASATLFRYSRETLKKSIMGNPAMAEALVGYLADSKTFLAHNIELLCLHDVEYRILCHLVALCDLVKPIEDGPGHQLPITQLELADLIGATRETTSTTLNHLERRGLVKLSRRLLTIPAPAKLRSAAVENLTKASSNGAAA